MIRILVKSSKELAFKFPPKIIPLTIQMAILNFLVLINIIIVYKIIYPDYSTQKLGVRIIHKNYMINFLLASCLTLFGLGWPKVCYIHRPNQNVFYSVINDIYWEISIEMCVCL